MRIKHLVLQGYKSFATKTEFEFPEGITAIVGPNGSGKSNVADAIRWAMGEQRMRLLRGKSSADMIFAGGERRSRAGMAEVALTLDNSEGEMPIEFSEVTLARRAYRSGENEYLINGSRVLLRDITELLAESGLSQRAYTVIGQGLVDAALSLRPEERRSLFEDAAGISLYRSRREDALERLEDTQHNLERVYDIISEISPRLRRLEGEMERTQEHTRLVEHLKRLQRTWYGHQWGEKQEALTYARQMARALKERFDKQNALAEQLSQRLTQLREQESDLRSNLREWHRQSADLHEKTNGIQRDLAVSEERARLLKVRKEELLSEIEPLKEQKATQKEKVVQLEASVKSLQEQLENRRQHLTDQENRWEELKERAQDPIQERARVEKEIRARRAEIERLGQELLETQESISQLENERAVAQERANQLKARREEILEELEPLEVQHESQVERVSELKTKVEDQEQRVEQRRSWLAGLERAWEARTRQPRESDDTLTKLQRQLDAHRRRIEELDRELLNLRSEAAEKKGQLEALNRLHAGAAAYTSGVRTILESDIDEIVGPLAQSIQVPPEWEKAIEAALGPDLQAIVIQTTSAVDPVRELLRKKGGRVTLLPLDAVSEPPVLPSHARCAADVVTGEGAVKPAVEALLGSIALCHDLAAAQRLIGRMPAGTRCVTSDGIVLRADGARLLGSAQDGGFLAEERTRREIPAQLVEIDGQCEHLRLERESEQKAVAALEAQIEERREAVAAAREAAVEAEREKVSEARTKAAVAEETLRNQQDALRRERSLLQQIVEQRRSLRNQAIELKAEREQILTRLEELDADESQLDGLTEGYSDTAPASIPARMTALHRRSDQIRQQQRAETRRIERLEAELEELNRRVEALTEEAAQFERETLSQARTEVAVAEQAANSERATLSRERDLLDQLDAQIEARQQRAREIDEERTRLQTHAERVRERAELLENELQQLNQRIEPAEKKLSRLRQEQVKTQAQERKAHQRVRDLEARHGRAQLKVDRREDELSLLAERIEEDLGLVELEIAESVTAQSPLPLTPLVSRLPIVEELPEGLEEEIHLLKARLNRLGSVNPNAAEEYEEVKERHTFLLEQSADLEKASSHLRQVVEELDEVMETTFKEIFEAVAEQFSKTFTRLFNGGQAELVLTEPDDLLNAGVEIMAQPPGKRSQRLALLSGGERALTAVALLFSLLHVSPTPFCVLDEVDAMLDEANVGRFRSVLQDLSETTQFIVITHNRVTIEAADTIYGISMGADAVSQAVSLKLEELSTVT